MTALNGPFLAFAVSPRARSDRHLGSISMSVTPEDDPAANKGILPLVLFMLGILSAAIIIGRLLQ
jgi:hypothetical protein